MRYSERNALILTNFNPLQTPHMVNEQAHVYIVDDDPAVRSALHLLAMSYGWEADAFSSAEDFLSRRPVPNEAEKGCLILDLRMPGMNGVELQEELRRRGGPMPTVVITAHPEQPLAREAQRAGAYAVLGKPFHDEELRVSVEGALHA
jgi:FixJ family two-component response regulator